MTYGEYLRFLRTGRNLTLKRASELIGISGQYLSEIERNGRKPLSDERCDNIKEAYALSPDEERKLKSLVREHESKGAIPPDIERYILDNPYIIEVLKKARDEGKTVKTA